MHQSGRGSPLPLLACRLFEQSGDEFILHYGGGFLCGGAAVGIDICRYFVVIMTHQLLRCLDIHPDPLEHRAICMPKHMRCEWLKYIVICCCSVSFGSLIRCL